MKPSSRTLGVVACVAVARAVVPFTASAQVTGQASELNGVGINEKLGDALPADVTFRNHEGKTVKLGDFFRSDRPIVLNFGYHTCPTVCNMILAATVDSLTDQPWRVGKEFEFVSISIDPRDTTESASKKRAEAISQYKHKTQAGWHFLTGEQGAAKRVADAAGFRYFYDENQGQYAHTAAMILLTPDGTIARYLYGLKFDPKDVRIGLLEASEGRTMSTAEKLNPVLLPL